MTPTDPRPVAIIGAGPTGLAAARNLDRQGIDWVGFELADDVGGLWNIDSPRSTVYESAHLISSARTTEFTEFPMPADTPDYPDHRRLLAYFRDFAEHFGLRDRYRFGTEVVRAEPLGPEPDAGWRLTVRRAGGDDDEELEAAGEFSALVVANGTLSEPNIPDFAGHFSGELLHTSRYKSATLFAGKRVLVVGAGNSGCDVAVDAVHHAASVDISVRRGYHFVPKYALGRPADTLGGGRPLPPRIKQFLDSRLLRLFTGDPVRFGFPEPDHKLYESHPIVNSLILQHVGHGDLRVRADVARFDGHTVHFRDGTSSDYDLVMLATGYVLHYPFLDRRHLDWPEGAAAPELYLNIFPSGRDDLAVLGMVEAAGIGWQGRYEQADLVARYLAARNLSSRRDTSASGRAAADVVDRGRRGPRPDLSGGYRYLGLDRMAYYVNKTAYRDAVTGAIARMEEASAGREGAGGERWTGVAR